MEQAVMINKLRMLAGDRLTENADMSKYTSFRAGGSAAALVEVENTEELRAVLQLVTEGNIPHMVIGNGSNMLFKDSGYDGIVIKLSRQGFDYVTIEGDNSVRVGTAMTNGALAKILQRESLYLVSFLLR